MSRKLKSLGNYFKVNVLDFSGQELHHRAIINPKHLEMWQPTFNFGSNLIENWSSLGWSSFMISQASISTHQKPIDDLGFPDTRIFPHLAQFKFNTFEFSLASCGFSSLLIGSCDWMFSVVLWHSIRKHSTIKKVLNCVGNVLLTVSSFRDKHALERGKGANQPFSSPLRASVARFHHSRAFFYSERVRFHPSLPPWNTTE